MPIADLMRLLRGRSGRAYFAETPRQALRWFVYNLQLNVSKLVSSEARFRYVQPDLTIGRGGDHDMVYYASLTDLRRHLRQQGAKIVSWSGVRLPPLSRRGRLALRGSGLKRKFVQSIAWPVTGITYLVARKQGGLS